MGVGASHLAWLNSGATSPGLLVLGNFQPSGACGTGSLCRTYPGLRPGLHSVVPAGLNLQWSVSPKLLRGGLFSGFGGRKAPSSMGSKTRRGSLDSARDRLF